MLLNPSVEVTFLPADPPRASSFAFWGDGVDANGEVELVLAAGAGARRRTVPARVVTMPDAIGLLLADDSRDLSPSAAAWAAATTAAIGLVARGRLLPTASPDGFDSWTVAPIDAEFATFLHDLAAAFPPAAHALPLPSSRPLRVASPEALIRREWDAVADALVRTPAAPVWSGGAGFADAEPSQVTPELATWLTDLGPGTAGGAYAVLQVEFGVAGAVPSDADGPAADVHAPVADESELVCELVLRVRSAADPSLLVDAADLWTSPTAVLARMGAQVESDLLVALRRGARVWPPLSRLLTEASPSILPLTDDELEDLLLDGAEALGSAGVEVLWPAELLGGGLALRASATPSPAAVAAAGFTMESLLDFQWQVTLGDDVLTQDEIDALAEAKRPLVRLRGRWIATDPEVLARLRTPPRTRITGAQALAATLTGSITVDGEAVEFTPPPSVAEAVAALSAGGQEVAVPQALHATLRPYQQRGLNWLAHLSDAGLGGCLADDMGLGKTVQVIALHLHRRQAAAGAGPTLVVCPTSLLGNWQREIHRFAPNVPVRRFHGGDRHLAGLADDEVVLATYGVIRRDAALLAQTGWGLVVADEAQHVKNPLSKTARELRAIPAAARVALTGTPVENRLTDLWSLLDWTTPGLLGGHSDFRRTFAVPVERYHDEDAAARLQRLTRPFLLRRRKTDPGIAPDLPPKTETDQIVSLTAEQTTLYEAVVREALATIARTDGIERRGLVLKLLTELKQICNHPAQFLKQTGPLVGRSGKLAALDELLEIIGSEGDSVLVFTQYVSMARLLEAHLDSLGVRSLMLHGHVPARRREQMVAQFQNGEAPVFLLSIKAGGVGLNLTRATHVIHYDRWWNPAVEDQATDRAYRIGQDRPVQVHRLIAEGTLEDRIAALLSSKRALADAVISSGEAWVSELSDDDLRALVELGAG